jgi:heme exporter protein C
MMTLPDRNPRLLRLFSAVSVIGFAIGLYLALAYAGMEANQGDVQRLFYMHLPSFAGALVAFTIAVIGGGLYLKTRQVKWDRLALCAVEVGFVMSLINTILGSVWARPIWNTWWTGDPRMIASAILTLLCIAYWMLRNGIENPERRRTVAALLSLVILAVLVYTSVSARLRPDTIHPVVIGASGQNRQGGFNMSSSMGVTLAVNLIVWCALITPTLIGWRLWLENLKPRSR